MVAASRATSSTATVGGLTVVVRGPGGVAATGGPGVPVLTATVGGRRVAVTPVAVIPPGADPIPLPAGTKAVELSVEMLSGRLTVTADGAELWVEPAD